MHSSAAGPAERSKSATDESHERRILDRADIVRYPDEVTR
jgi:hypothetical protein